MRWVDRLIGLLSTLILARLLAPEDFGIIAMASLAIGLTEVLLNLGVNVALIQNRNPTIEHYNTAWTLRIIQMAVAAIAIATAAPYAAQYFEEARLVSVLYVMAFVVLLGGLENIGIITFQKEMRFGLDFRFMFLKRLAGFLITIVAAWLFRNYWALVVGSLGGRVVGVLLSYRFHPMRPRLSLARFKDIFAVSQWTLANSIGSYLSVNLHKIAVGRIATSGTMGAYALADEISAMPTSELLSPLNRVLFPAFVQAKNDQARLKELFLLAQGLQTLVAVPASVGLALVAESAVLVLLGKQWSLAVPFVQLLALANVVQAITTSGGYVMLTLGHFKRVAAVTWVQASTFLLLSLAALPKSHAQSVASLHLLTVFVGFILALRLITATLPGLRLLDVARSVARPFIGTVVMAIVLLTSDPLMPQSPLLTLLAQVAVGALTYSSSVALMWWMSGRAAGPESYLLNNIGTLLKRGNGSVKVHDEN